MATTHPAWVAVGRLVRVISSDSDTGTEFEIVTTIAEHTPDQVTLPSGDRFMAAPDGTYTAARTNRRFIDARIEPYTLVVDHLPTDGLDLETVVRDVLTRTNDVRDWPADEQKLFRGWRQDFMSRTAAIAELRVQKILLAARAS